MKKLIFCSVLILFATTSFAQIFLNTTPRWGTPPNNNNTGGNLTYSNDLFTMAGASVNNDSLKVYTYTYYTQMQQTDTLVGATLVLVDTVHGHVDATAYTPAYWNQWKQTYPLDRLELTFVSKVNTNVVTFGYGFHSNSTLSVTANKSAHIVFVFDPVNYYWVEISRSVE